VHIWYDRKEVVVLVGSPEYDMWQFIISQNDILLFALVQALVRRGCKVNF
jgi:hypothetical protein